MSQRLQARVKTKDAHKESEDDWTYGGGAGEEEIRDVITNG